MHTSKNLGLIYLKAVCCLGIVLSHGSAYAEYVFDMPYGDALDFPGRYGMLQFVSFFFLITGYYVTMQISNNACTSIIFLKKRFKKIYPTYWIASCLLLFLNVCYFHNFQTSVGFYKSLFLIAGEHNTICRDEWTLYVQVLFYLIAALFFDGLRLTYPFFLVSYLLVIVFYNSFKCTTMIGVTYDVLIKTVPTGSIALGGIIYYVEKGLPKIIKKMPLFLSCALLTAFSLIYDWIKFYPAYIFVPLYYLIVTAVFVCFKNTNMAALDAPLKKFSELSYAIYLIHPTIYLVLFNEMKKLGISWTIYSHVFVIFINLLISTMTAMFIRKVNRW